MSLDDFCRQNRGDCETLMTESLNMVVGLRDSYLADFDKIYTDYGLQFIVHDGTLIPKPKHERIGTIIITGKSLRS
jgi:hypothetical protein